MTADAMIHERDDPMLDPGGVLPETAMTMR
jgi:hypothetical protein